MRDILNLLDSMLAEATLEASQIIKYPERFDAFISHIQDRKPFYTDKEGTEVVLDPSEADRFLQLRQDGKFRGSVQGKDLQGKLWSISNFRKTAEFGGASAKPGETDTSELKKEGAQVKPGQIGIVNQDIPASKLHDVIVNNIVLQSTDYGRAVIEIANNIVSGKPAVIPAEFAKNEQVKKAIVDYAGEYLGVLALIHDQSSFPSRDEFLKWLGGNFKDLVLFFPSSVSNPLADSFASITNTKTGHTLNISSKGTGGGAPPSMSSLKIPDELRKKKQYQTAIDIVDLVKNENLPIPKTVSQVFQMMNLMYERMPDKIPTAFVPFLPWDQDIVAQVKDSLKNRTPMPKYNKLFADLDSKGSDGGKLTYVTKSAVMNLVNGGQVPEFQAVILEILDYNFIQQYADAKKGVITFSTQWPAKLDGEVTMETKSGGTDPTKGGFSFKLKPKGQKGQAIEKPTDADIPAVSANTSADELDTQTQKRSSVTARKGGLEEEEEIVKPLRDNVPVFGRKRQR